MIELEPQQKHLMKPSYDFYMNVTSTNPEQQSSVFDNEFSLSVPVWVDAKLITDGYSFYIYYFNGISNMLSLL